MFHYILYCLNYMDYGAYDCYNCVPFAPSKTVRSQLKHKLADLSYSNALPSDHYQMKMAHESNSNEPIKLRVMEVTHLREGNKVEEHVKRVVDCMEAKQLKNKGKKRKHQNNKRKPARFATTSLILRKNADLLKFLFHKFGVGEDRWSEEVARYGEFTVTRADLQCLSPATSLSCKVINICAAFLNVEDSDCWFLPTYFGEQARCNEEPSSYSYWLECTVRMCDLKRFHRRLHLCSKIFTPLRIAIR